MLILGGDEEHGTAQDVAGQTTEQGGFPRGSGGTGSFWSP